MSLFIPNCPTVPIILLVFITYNGPAIVTGSSDIKINVNMIVSVQGLLSNEVHEQIDSCKTVHRLLGKHKITPI